MTTDRPVAEGPHNHPPICCCSEQDPSYPDNPHAVIACPACPEHGTKPEPIVCPQCHTEIGRPHTEYCSLSLREEVFAEPPRLVCRRCNGYGLVLVDGEQTPCPDCRR